MDRILVQLIIGAALLQLGISFSKLGDCTSLNCRKEVRRASKDVLKIDWKPISVFPEEAQYFR